MAVEFPSDIVFDVVRAADPAQAQKVAHRLSAGADAAATARSVAETSRLERAGGPSDVQSAAKEFEALLVGEMIGDMMGDAEESYFGGGFAGGVWKSMMAQQIAAVMVERADFGVASVINGYFTQAGEAIEPVPGISSAEHAPAETRARDAALSTAGQLDRDFVRDLLGLASPADDSLFETRPMSGR